MKAHHRYFIKYTVQDRYLVVMSIHDLEGDVTYPLGSKYGFICKDMKTDVFVLMDNHHPKGPHLHVNDQEFEYVYIYI